MLCGRLRGTGGFLAWGYQLASLLMCSQHGARLLLLHPSPWRHSWVLPLECLTSWAETRRLRHFPYALEQRTQRRERGAGIMEVSDPHTAYRTCWDWQSLSGRGLLAGAAPLWHSGLLLELGHSLSSPPRSVGITTGIAVPEQGAERRQSEPGKREETRANFHLGSKEFVKESPPIAHRHVAAVLAQVSSHWECQHWGLIPTTQAHPMATSKTLLLSCLSPALLSDQEDRCQHLGCHLCHTEQSEGKGNKSLGIVRRRESPNLGSARGWCLCGGKGLKKVIFIWAQCYSELCTVRKLCSATSPGDCPQPWSLQCCWFGGAICIC